MKLKEPLFIIILKTVVLLILEFSWLCKLNNEKQEWYEDNMNAAFF